MAKKVGAVPIQVIREMAEAGFIQGASLKNLQPASLDLTVGGEMYRVRSVFLPRKEEPILEAMKRVNPEPHPQTTSLEVGITYLVRLKEELVLPEDIRAYANPKSSTGRNDVHVRMLADGVQRFDSAGIRGYRGSLWALVTPRSFRVKLNTGDSLLQIRFFNQDTRFDDETELEIAYRRRQLLFTPAGEPIEYSQVSREPDGSLILTVNLDLELAGYHCGGSQEVLDFSKRGFYEPGDFFQPLARPQNGAIMLRRGDFYIFSTKEFLRVPPELAAEMVPVDIRAGDYRAQYAGYFDCGWGYGRDGALKGAPAVLEMRPFEDNLIIRDGQPICKVTFERMMEIPEFVYGETGSHYFNQCGPRLSKHFRSS